MYFIKEVVLFAAILISLRGTEGHFFKKRLVRKPIAILPSPCGPYMKKFFFKCICITGYVKGANGKCVKINPCGGKCDKHASCQKNKCVCDNDYVGDGFVCKKPCDGLCHPKAYCRYDNTCVCNEGYKGDGKSCTDIPCRGKCVANARCKNDACVCKSGYYGDGYTLCECTPNTGGY